MKADVNALALLLTAAVASLATYARTASVADFAKAGEQDDTESIQAAIDSGADEVVVPNRGRPWIVRPLRGRSNLKLSLEKGAVLEAKKGEYRDAKACVLTFDCCTNVTVRGYGATLRMHRLDYHAAPYKRGEWRHGLSFLSCVNVLVEGLSIVETGGDGIYLGVDAARDPELANFHVVIRDVACLRNNRQGISVISAEDLLIENCELSETYGTSPEAGIDFEPNRADQRFVDCRMKNCRMRNNMGSGFELWCPRFDGTTRPVSILVEDCETECNNEEVRFRDYSRKNGKPKTPPRGTVTFRNCTFRNMRNEYIYAGHETGRGIALKIENCTIVDEPNPDRILARNPVRELFDDAPGVLKSVPPMAQTGLIGYAFCVDRARTVTIKAKVGKVEPLPTRKGRPVKGLVVDESLSVLGGDGGKVAELELPPGDKTDAVEWKFGVPSAGVYTFGGFANRSVSVIATDAPLAVDVSKGGRDFIMAAGDLYAYVPSGIPSIVVTVAGRSRQERVSLAIFDPCDQLRGKRTWVESCERYLFRNPEEGLWRFELREPSVGKFAGYGFDFLGGLGYLFLDRNRTWRQ